ncbi:DUF2306 domain-containing protein [Emticicia aquatilis]|nr:DUF2306 domain-containing protein [Emticicia aquatilis]
MKKVIWIIIVILALLVGFIPITYLTSGVSKGYLELKSQEALRSTTWWFFLYMHIISGGIAILIGWLQFSSILLKKYSRLHRIIGKIYLASALACSLSGFYIGFYATGGLIPAVGFITVSCIYFYTTLMGFLLIRRKQIIQHQNFMTYSYATCLSAVSLRLSVPFSYLFTDNYILSYSIIAWTAWIPNLLVAYWVNKNREEKIPINLS